MSGDRQLTKRGFPLYVDDQGSPGGFPEQRVRVQESSRAGEGPFVFIFGGEPGGFCESVQLSVRQALLVAQGLLAWANDAVYNKCTEPFVKGDEQA